MDPEKRETKTPLGDDAGQQLQVQQHRQPYPQYPQHQNHQQLWPSGVNTVDHREHWQPNYGAVNTRCQPPYPGAATTQGWTPSTNRPGQPTIMAPVTEQDIEAIVREALLPSHKKVCDVYLLGVVLGLLGVHHFYLRRHGWGVLYFFTGGLLGFGYIIDLFRIPYLVKRYNEENSCSDNQSKKCNRKNLSDAYVAWFPFGLLGFHHYYLGRYAWGVLYTLTFGLFGIGWLVDCFRMSSLVREYNDRAELNHSDIGGGVEEKRLLVSYLLGIPFGWLGLHHFYMNRMLFGMWYALTFGLFGIGWIVDLFRMPVLLRRCNEEIRKTRRPFIATLDDCYILWFPFGLLGYHHLYLRRFVWSILYFLTLGIFGIGWLVDLCRIPSLVKEHNERMDRLFQLRIVAGPCVQADPKQHAADASPPPYQQCDNTPCSVPSPPPYHA